MTEDDAGLELDLEVAQRGPLRLREAADMVLGEGDVPAQLVAERIGGRLERVLADDEVVGVPAVELARPPAHRVDCRRSRGRAACR